MALLDIVIEVLKINCSAVQCTGYASDIEALFFLVFFPMVFIILFAYVISGVIFDKAGGKEGALRLLIGVAMVAFIIFQSWFSFFISLSKLWWLLVVGLVGLFVFIKQMVHGKSGGGPFSTAKSGRGFGGYMTGKAKRRITEEEKDLKKAIEKTMQNLRSHVNLIEREVNKESSYTDIANLINTYTSHKNVLLNLLEKLSAMGKVEIHGMGIDIDKKSNKYYDELGELDKRVEEITQKINKK